jgi:Uncharacterized protein conserved in bacteria
MGEIQRPGLIYIVFGAHSSGTSCVAGVLHHLGVSMGNRLIGYYGNNPETLCGFEDADLAAICMRAVPITFNSVRIPLAHVEEQLRQWIQKRKQDHGLAVGGKHPLLCLFGDSLYRICGDSMRAVFVERPLESSIRSIISRPDVRCLDIDKVITHMHWLDSEKRKFRESLPNEIKTVVSYEDLVADPEKHVRGIVEFLDYLPSEEQIKKAIYYVKPSLLHQKKMTLDQWPMVEYVGI